MAKQRAPNFTLQENTLLAHLMGEEYMNFGMSSYNRENTTMAPNVGHSETCV
ncbi:hypothetical protein DPMN_059004 [Dreissena polymorpha]|uniref:Uncharacterized protein n=1 Tax=Dreissena polymorpha TaxID=45954 RepID=A0A9D4HGT9_DREPO|nr:hypothetical protein DPMN_059004 [Dreissena polymorpha]